MKNVIQIIKNNLIKFKKIFLNFIKQSLDYMKNDWREVFPIIKKYLKLIMSFLQKMYNFTRNKIKNILEKSVEKLKRVDLTKTKKFILKHKKVVIILFFVFYTSFWFWFFSERSISFEEQNNKVVKQENTGKESGNKQESNKKNNGKNFSQEQLGDFWLEIDTDEVKIKAPIVNGTSDYYLDKGIGRHKITALPNEKGNVVLSGHRWKMGKNPSYTVFEDLDKLKNGDIVKIHYSGRIYEYEIFGSGVVKNNKKGFQEVMKKTDDKMVTLCTCTPKYTSWKRLYYRGKLIK